MEKRAISDIPPVVLAYTAGLVDGEGTISIRRRRFFKDHQVEEYVLCLSVAQKDRMICDWLKAQFDRGSVVVKRHHKPMTWETHVWDLTYNAAFEVMQAIRPYLIIKARQADIGLAFQAAKRAFRHRSLKGMRGRLATSPELMDRYREWTVEIQSLNRRVREEIQVGPRPKVSD